MRTSLTAFVLSLGMLLFGTAAQATECPEFNGEAVSVPLYGDSADAMRLSDCLKKFTVAVGKENARRAGEVIRELEDGPMVYVISHSNSGDVGKHTTITEVPESVRGYVIQQLEDPSVRLEVVVPGSPHYQAAVRAYEERAYKHNDALLLGLVQDMGLAGKLPDPVEVIASRWPEKRMIRLVPLAAAKAN